MQRFTFVSLGLLVVALSLSGTAADPHCPFDWSFFNGHCYKVFRKLKSWNNAEMFCRQQEEGGHLASIQSHAEAAYVARVVSRDVFLINVWIGLSDPWKQRTWVWSDGSRFLYRSWKGREPNNFLWREYCVELWSLSRYLKWNDQSCGSLRYFICKFQPQGTGADHPCPLDWLSFEHFCYKLIKQWKTWADAETFCVQQQNGSHLASIQSWAESAYVARVLFTNMVITKVWIGLSDPEKKRTWEWSDGSKLGYTSWERRQPNNLDDKYCVELSRRSSYVGWKAVDCESKRFFICKLQPKSEEST